MPVRSADGLTLIKDRKGILDRWAQYLNALLNNHTDSNNAILNDLSELPTHEGMDLPPNLQDMITAVEGLKPRKALGPDMLPAELLVEGDLASRECLHELILQIWRGKSIPVTWKDALFTNIYNNKGDKAMLWQQLRIISPGSSWEGAGQTAPEMTNSIGLRKL